MSKFLFYDFDIVNILGKNEQPSGGAAVQTFVWVLGLQTIGQEVLIIKNQEDNREVKSEWKHLKIVNVNHMNKGKKWIRWITHRFPSIFILLKKEIPDFLYESNPGWVSFYIGIMCKILGIKYIVRIPLDAQLDERYKKDHSMFHVFFMNLGLRLSYCILCQNDYQTKLIKQEFPDKKSLKIYNPFISPDQKIEQKTERDTYIAWVANFRYQKNLKLLFEIASLLTSYEFRIAGSTTSMKDSESTEYLEKLKHLPNVQIIGFIPRNEIMGFIGRARFLLNTSRYEGFSNTFLEAMHMGTPIISTENVNPDNIISDLHLGIIYGSPINLKEQLGNLTASQYVRMTDNCKIFVKENHDHLKLAQKLLTFLHDQS